jgi:hypothetical protein
MRKKLTDLQLKFLLLSFFFQASKEPSRKKILLLKIWNFQIFSILDYWDIGFWGSVSRPNLILIRIYNT